MIDLKYDSSTNLQVRGVHVDCLRWHALQHVSAIQWPLLSSEADQGGR